MALVQGRSEGILNVHGRSQFGEITLNRMISRESASNTQDRFLGGGNKAPSDQGVGGSLRVNIKDALKEAGTEKVV